VLDGSLPSHDGGQDGYRSDSVSVAVRQDQNGRIDLDALVAPTSAPMVGMGWFEEEFDVSRRLLRWLRNLNELDGEASALLEFVGADLFPRPTDRPLPSLVKVAQGTGW
jgi:hypothetical protein